MLLIQSLNPALGKNKTYLFLDDTNEERGLGRGIGFRRGRDIGRRLREVDGSESGSGSE